MWLTLNGSYVVVETAPHVRRWFNFGFHLLHLSQFTSVWCLVSHTAALGTDPRSTTDTLGEAGRARIEPRASLEFNRRATNVKNVSFRTKSRQVLSPSDSASEPTRVNLIRPAPSRDAIDRERVYGAGITGDARVVHSRVGGGTRHRLLLTKSHFPLLKVTHFFVTASHAARTSSGGAATPKSFSKCS